MVLAEHFNVSNVSPSSEQTENHKGNEKEKETVSRKGGKKTRFRNQVEMYFLAREL